MHLVICRLFGYIYIQAIHCLANLIVNYVPQTDSPVIILFFIGINVFNELNHKAIMLQLKSLNINDIFTLFHHKM